MERNTVKTKKEVRPLWTTTVDPSEYDYVAQFTQTVKWANRDKACFIDMDIGKVWGLVEAYRRLERENAELREDKERLDWLEKEIRCGKTHSPQAGVPDAYIYSFLSENWPTSHSPIPPVRAAIDAAREKEAQQ
jgi:hypothetical protein